MTPFSYERATDAAGAIRALTSQRTALYLGGGTNLVDLMREGLERPSVLVDVTGLSQRIDEREDGSLLIGAAVSNTALAEHDVVRRAYPMLSRAILTGASGQIRNMATVGGNILQRTRCAYFYDHATRCNKRAPGDGCDARDGFNRNHAILGASPACIATHPSDMCVALAALDAQVHLVGPDGARTLPFSDIHRLAGDRPDRDTELRPAELIVAVELPPVVPTLRSTYRKVRDRASYAFALVSVAAAIDVAQDGTIIDVRLALGGVAHKPWRARKSEAMLRGQSATSDNFRRAADSELSDARPLAHNAFKVELAARAITATLESLTAEARS